MPTGIYKRTEEHKRKLREALTGEKNPWTGRHHTIEARKKMSIVRKGQYAKENHPRWGVKLTEETKDKIRKKNSGRKFSVEHKQKIKMAITGITRSEKTREKISETKKGQKNPNWRGGKSFEPYGLEFNNELKEKIRERDNHTCQECGYTEKELGYALTCHHIDYDKKNNVSENLIALCKSCHSKTNFRRKDWVKHYTEMI